jgi:Spy/CpxP family protein refolding chaperone
MKVASVMLSFATICLFGATACLAALPKEKPERDFRGPSWEMFERMLSRLDLTADQKAKVADLKKEYAPKFEELRKKAEDLLTGDQKKARDTARKEAREAGTNFGEAMQAARKAMNLTDEQKKKLGEAMRAGQDTVREARQKISDLLTPEQKETLEKFLKQRKGRRGEKK